MSAPYILRRDGHDYQAPDLETLRAWAQAGRVLPADLVYSPVYQTWYRASDLRGLRDVLPVQEAGPPPVVSQSVAQCFWLRKGDQNYAAETIEIILQWASQGVIDSEDFIFHPAYGKWFQAGHSPQLTSRFPPHIRVDAPFLPASADPMASAEARLSAELPSASAPKATTAAPAPAPRPQSRPLAVVAPAPQAESPAPTARSLESADSMAKTVMDMQAIRLDMLRPGGMAPKAPSAAPQPVASESPAAPAEVKDAPAREFESSPGPEAARSATSDGLFGGARPAVGGASRPSDPTRSGDGAFPSGRTGPAPAAAVLRRSGAHPVFDAAALREVERLEAEPRSAGASTPSAPAPVSRVAQPILDPHQSAESVSDVAAELPASSGDGGSRGAALQTTVSPLPVEFPDADGQEDSSEVRPTEELAERPVGAAATPIGGLPKAGAAPGRPTVVSRPFSAIPGTIEASRPTVAQGSATRGGESASATTTAEASQLASAALRAAGLSSPGEPSSNASATNEVTRLPSAVTPVARPTPVAPALQRAVTAPLTWGGSGDLSQTAETAATPAPASMPAAGAATAPVNVPAAGAATSPVSVSAATAPVEKSDPSTAALVSASPSSSAERPVAAGPFETPLGIGPLSARGPAKPPPLPASVLGGARPTPPPLPSAALAAAKGETATAGQGHSRETPEVKPETPAPVAVAEMPAAAPSGLSSGLSAPTASSTSLDASVDGEVKFVDRLGLMKLFYDVAKVFVYTRDLRPGELLESSCTFGQGGVDFLGTAKRAIYYRLCASIEEHLQSTVSAARGQMSPDELPGYELMLQRADALLASMRKAEPIIGQKPPERVVVGNTGRPKMSSEEETSIVEIDANLKRLISTRAKVQAGRAA